MVQCSQCYRILPAFPCNHCKVYSKTYSDVPFDKSRKKKPQGKAKKSFEIGSYRREQIGEMKKEVRSQQQSDASQWERRTGRSIV